MMYVSKRDKKDEEDGAMTNPFHNLEKTAVLQEARLFNDTPVNPRKCAHILTKILYLLNQGEQLGATEATDAFFAMTRLFQCKDITLRRLMYLTIKELSKTANDIIIVTSSLTKDMTGKEDQYRGAAIRALCKITDASMLQSLERYMKQAIVDKNHSVASAALVSSHHLMKMSPDVVKRWVNEAQEAVNTDNHMVQYHALGLLYHIRKSDRLSVSKLLAKYTHSSLRSPFAVGLLIRIASKIIEEEGPSFDSPLFEFIENCLRHKSEMVVYEAAHAIVNMKSTTSRELAPAVSVLQLFCSSPKPTLRFAAVRTLNKVAMSHPAAVTACNLDLESLITDVNRSIATLAITTLLKTGSESSVDRLMKQIASFMSEISDEFKIVVVEAIRSLCQKFPSKHSVMMNFLSSMLREEGGFEYKKAIVNTVINIIEDNPDSKEAGLAHLCEFIEDCEHTSLGVRILHLLGKEGPRANHPAKYIRFIYNRLILETAPVRAAAVSSLAKFGACCEQLLPNILVLLQRSLLDTDDEVRDRATYYLSVLRHSNKAYNYNFILQGLQASVVGLEKALLHYSQEPSDTPFDLRTVPIATQPLLAEEDKKKPEITKVGKQNERVAASRQDLFAEQLESIPALAALDLGPLFKSSVHIPLTEIETEYVVSCIKHTFTDHIVFQFDCTNTLSDQILENVQVQMELTEGFEVVCYVPCSKLAYNVQSTCYTCVRLPDDPLAVSSTSTNTLRFVVRECDPGSGEPFSDEGYKDEYALEDLEVAVGDHLQKTLRSNFAVAWEEMEAVNELEDTFSLVNTKSIEEAVKNVIQFLGLQPCERSDKVPEGKNSHTLFLAGIFRGGAEVLARVKLALVDGVTMNMVVRSTSPHASEIIISAIG